MQRATPSGPRSITTPRASSTSAEPASDDDARPPCLQTGTPAPATTMAAIVDTLILPLRSPPVPQVSMSRACSSGPTGTIVDASSMARTRPVISSTVSPLQRSPKMNAVICTGVARPPSISARTAPASAEARLRRWVRRLSTPAQPPRSSSVGAPVSVMAASDADRVQGVAARQARRDGTRRRLRLGTFVGARPDAPGDGSVQRAGGQARRSRSGAPTALPDHPTALTLCGPAPHAVALTVDERPLEAGLHDGAAATDRPRLLGLLGRDGIKDVGVGAATFRSLAPYQGLGLVHEKGRPRGGVRRRTRLYRPVSGRPGGGPGPSF
jgi:hypothetical protein